MAQATAAPAYTQPTIDVTALTALLDGKYAEIRDLVRTNLAEYYSILVEEETLGRDEFRYRVRDVVVEMARTGQTGMGFPTEYGGGGDIGASIAAFETLALGDLSVLVKVGVQFGLFGEEVRPLIGGLEAVAVEVVGHVDPRTGIRVLVPRAADARVLLDDGQISAEPARLIPSPLWERVARSAGSGLEH